MRDLVVDPTVCLTLHLTLPRGSLTHVPCFDVMMSLQAHQRRLVGREQHDGD
jgi:hypothetical protein